MPITGTQPALTEDRVGMMRLGGSRLGYVLPIPYVTIDDVVRTSNVRVAGASIRDILNGTPNTATMRVDGFTPTEGHEVVLNFGVSGPTQFRGRILSTTKLYEGKPANVAWDCSCISEELLLNKTKVTRRYLSTSATAIILDLISAYAPGFSSAGVASGLPSLDEITFTSEDVTDCLDRICQRIGEDWQLDYERVLHVPAADGMAANAITDSDDHGMSGIAVSTDLSQVRTRQSGEGGGSNTSTDIAVGQTTMPIDDTTWYPASGGAVVSGPQRIAYTSKSTIDGTGSKVGGKAGLEPGAPTVAVVADTPGKIEPGVYTYQLTHLINGGETVAGTVSGSVTITHVTAPSGPGSLAATTGGSLTPLINYAYGITYVTAAGETPLSPTASVTLGGSDNAVSLTSIPTSSDGRVTGRKLYRWNTETGVNGWNLVTTLNNVATTYTDNGPPSATFADPPNVNTSGSGQIALTNIPLGPTGTTARSVYRSGPSDSVQSLVGTVGDNTTTTFTDNVANASRGRETPSAARGGSTVPPSAGDTTLPVQECSAFASGGGWVNVAGQLVRYTGRSVSSGAGTLTGVPASGIGALAASVQYGTAIINAPHLTGVTGVLYAINKGESVNIWVTRNDTAAQTFMASALTTASYTHDGIIEADPIQDRRMSETEITARCDAKLEELSTPLVSVRYQTRDVTTRSGRTVTVTLAAPISISGTFSIQSVTMSGFSANGEHRPLYQVECSSRLLTFEQILRIRKAV